MAVTAKKSYSLDLPTDAFSGLVGIAPEMQQILQTLLDAVSSLAETVDVYGAVNELTPESMAAILAAGDTFNANSYARLCSFRIKAGEDLPYGTIVTVGSDGLGYKHSIRSVAGYPVPSIAGFSTADVKAGEYVLICYSGLLRVNLTAAQQLYAIQVPGYAGNATTSFPKQQYSPYNNVIPNAMSGNLLGSYIDSTNVIVEAF